MKIEDFVAGKFVKCYQYDCFVPEFINHDWTWDSKSLTMQLERSVKALSALDACAQFVPDIDLFIRMHIVREASASSRIEGTQTEIEEVVLPESAIQEERRDDWREVNNYVEAMNSAIETLKDLPLSIRLLRGAHERLLSGVRGEWTEAWKRFALDLGAEEFPSFSGDDREKDVQALRQWIASAVQAFVRGKGLTDLANQWKDGEE